MAARRAALRHSAQVDSVLGRNAAVPPVALHATHRGSGVARPRSGGGHRQRYRRESRQSGPRASNQFVPYTTAGVDEHSGGSRCWTRGKGAFRGELECRSRSFGGRRRIAFLDEIGEMPLELQRSCCECCPRRRKVTPSGRSTIPAAGQRADIGGDESAISRLQVTAGQFAKTSSIGSIWSAARPAIRKQEDDVADDSLNSFWAEDIPKSCTRPVWRPSSQRCAIFANLLARERQFGGIK